MLADSHIHLFSNGYKDSGEDELSLYKALMDQYAIECALIVGYEGAPWAMGNNKYIASLLPLNPWMHPLAFVGPADLSINTLKNFQSMGFEGISIYLNSTTEVEALSVVDTSVWEWLTRENWIVSVNSVAQLWLVWLEILKKFPHLIMLISHFGLPEIDTKRTQNKEIESQFHAIAQLLEFENVYLKLSGFYALETEPSPYPFTELNSHIEYVVKTFNPNRLLWGSDFTPVLGSIEFQQTFDHLLDLPAVDPSLLSKILHDNLVNLFNQSPPQ
ncbi:unannotated protein [freshwater metagenome]|uniref:Unannotated protein n=1 Tax=freshwater metagenome TaxID=449393 RepID=A0A6J7MFJ0_9ZZZZ|nr:amidohydrolase family protein [Actinomycetota bacterium]